VKASPSVRQLARKLGINLTALAGTGPGGRILVEDLTSRIKPESEAKKARPESHADYGTPGAHVKFHGLRRRIAERMVQSKHTIPHCTVIEECDVSELVRLRAGLKEPLARAGVSLTYLPFFVKAVMAGLKEVPIMNASLDEAAGEIVLHDHYHVGIAVATAAGLVVPVVREADKKDLATLAREIAQKGNEARAGRLKPEDLRGGTFTITSVGNIGGLISTPLINHPEVAILGTGRIVKRPVFDEHDRVRPAHLLYLSLSFDHRVIDGAVAVAFINVLIRELRSPAGMLLPASGG
jgi:pyruvate dehydrogenase E2 component (dihydrolipoamide acetyltransferase)/2-oxoisovalerate dehydrogenase E2 component (dihydrolipoyl transacylase)